ncbi:hypothetical protein DFH06DRAFT_1321928 [Mycena polygramma]|nr:hypothetical protein DFH06DRAFT_1321928 [Mycena polygramma]
MHWPRANTSSLRSVPSANRPHILVSGFIRDYIGKDASASLGGVYEHSNAAHHLLAMKRVGALHGGLPLAVDEQAVPPS